MNQRDTPPSQRSAPGARRPQPSRFPHARTAHTRPVHATRGIALVMALGVLAVVGILVAGSMITTQLELGITRNDATATQAHYVAQAGLHKYKANLFQHYRWLEGFYTPQANPPRTACFNRLGAGVDWDRNPATAITPWSGNRVAFPEETVYDADGEPVGEYQVTLIRDANNNKVYTLESRGASRGARATLRATVQLDNTGVLEQAIFSGHGQANKFINGGVTIRGGVYVVGDENSPDETVFNSNGDFSLLNDYDLTGLKYGPVTDRVTSANRTAQQLCATLRVEHGRVELDGSVKLGDPDNRLLGVYIGDDVTEDLIINTTLLECELNKGVCADDGPASFDISSQGAPEFPFLDDPPAERGSCRLASWRACIDAEAASGGVRAWFEGTDLVVQKPISEPSPAPQGITVRYNNGLPLFYAPTDAAAADLDDLHGCWLQLAARELALDRKLDCTVRSADGQRTYGFSYEPKGGGNPGRLRVYGTVNLVGYHLLLPEEVDYYARSVDGTLESASLVVQDDGSGGGDIDLNANLLTGTLNASRFPDNVLALVAEHDVFQDAPFVMAPIYAGGTFRIVKDRVLLGSVIADYFCTTGAGGTTAKEKKLNSKAAADKCNAGQNAEVIYVNTGNNKPAIMRLIQDAGVPVFKVLSQELR